MSASARYVIKRDGKKVPFDKYRISLAIEKTLADIACDDLSIASIIADDLFVELPQTTLTIDEIQKAVENKLMSTHKEAARAYIVYRRQRDIVREKGSSLNKEIHKLLKKDADVAHENANKDCNIIPTMRDQLAGTVARHYALNHVLPADVAEAHESGDIHYHDLDYSPFFPMFNCMLVDLEGMLTKGFKIGNAEIESPKSIATATAITAQVIAQVASHIYGGTSINQIDRIHAPYVTASYNKHLERGKRWLNDLVKAKNYAMECTEKETFDAYQALEYEINTLHTANGQTPFVTFGFGLGTTWQERLIQKSILQNRINGLGKNRKPAVFPKLVLGMKKGVNVSPEDPNYDIKQLALKCASERMYPDILSHEKLTEVAGDYKVPMGCRSFLPAWQDENGEFINDGRNNLGVVTINLPRIAIEAGGDKEKFFNILNRRMVIARKALDTRIKSLENIKANVAPILYMEGACGVRLKADDFVSEIFKNGRATISLGYIGLHEACTALMGEHIHTFDSPDKKSFCLSVIKVMKSAVEAWKNETGYSFGLYGTPSESLCYRFCKLDIQQFGEKSGVTDKGYYTNSFHLDVEKNASPYDKIDFESIYPQYSSGGFITYSEFPNMRNNLKALENIWDYAIERVPYYGTNTPIDSCYECGFEGEFRATSKGFICPCCDNSEQSKMSVTRRVCGYLGQPDSRPFNSGKQEEVIRRVKHL